MVLKGFPDECTPQIDERQHGDRGMVAVGGDVWGWDGDGEGYRSTNKQGYWGG